MPHPHLCGCRPFRTPKQTPFCQVLDVVLGFGFATSIPAFCRALFLLFNAGTAQRALTPQPIAQFSDAPARCRHCTRFPRCARALRAHARRAAEPRRCACAFAILRALYAAPRRARCALPRDARTHCVYHTPPLLPAPPLYNNQYLKTLRCPSPPLRTVARDCREGGRRGWAPTLQLISLFYLKVCAHLGYFGITPGAYLALLHFHTPVEPACLTRGSCFLHSLNLAQLSVCLWVSALARTLSCTPLSPAQHCHAGMPATSGCRNETGRPQHLVRLHSATSGACLPPSPTCGPASAYPLFQ